MKQYLDYDSKRKTGLSIYYYIHNFFKKVELAFLIFVCLILITISKNNPLIYNKISLFFVNISIPISKVISSPIDIASNAGDYISELISAKRENAILKAENEKLKSLYIKALNISQENDELRELINFISTKSVKYKSVRLISSPNSTFHNHIFINAGKNQGIKENSVITGKRSVVGRVVNVGDDISKVLKISSNNSKIPVITSNSRERGILVGTNSKIMLMEYLDKNHNVFVGDMVFTSGDGEYLPPGLLVGVVSYVNGINVKVKLIENPDNINLAAISIY